MVCGCRSLCLEILGALTAFVYILPWMILTIFLPFLFGWKKFFLAAAMEMLKGAYGLNNGNNDDFVIPVIAAFKEQAITFVQFGSGLVSALVTFIFLAMNRTAPFQKAPHLQYIFLLIGLASCPICLLMAYYDLEREKNFLVFSILMLVSGLSEGVFKATQDGTLEFFYKNNQRHLRIFLSGAAEGIGVAFGLWCGRYSEDAKNEDIFSKNVLLGLTLAFFFILAFLLLVVIHNLCCRFACGFPSYPSEFVRCCLTGAKTHDADTDDSMVVKHQLDTSVEMKKCCLPMAAVNNNNKSTRADEGTDWKPASLSTRKLLFHAMTLCQLFTAFARNGFLFWGLRHLEEQSGENMSNDYYGIQLVVGSFLGALGATLFLKFYLNKKKVVDDVFVAVICGLVSLSVTSLFLFLYLPLDDVIAVSPELIQATVWPTNIVYLFTMTAEHILIDEVQFLLIAPKWRSLALSAELLVEEVTDAVSPFAVEMLVILLKGQDSNLTAANALAYAMIYLLPGAAFVGLPVFLVLSIFALSRRRRRRLEGKEDVDVSTSRSNNVELKHFRNAILVS